MNADELFLSTLDDLERRTTATDEYEVLLAAGLLRKLLMDSRSLVDQVNNSHRLPIRFLINGPTKYEELVLSHGPVYWSLEDAIDPGVDHPPGLRAPQEVKIAQLLSRQVMMVDGHEVSVRDLIDQLANIEGAVHSGRPRNPRQEILQQAARTLFIGGLPAGVRQVQSIARVVLRGLTPLRDAVRSARS